MQILFHIPILNILVILLGFILQMYWVVTEQIADKAKPKTEKLTFTETVKKRAFSISLALLLLAQLLGLQVLPFSTNTALKLLGLLLVILGTSICIISRHILGTNWTAGQEYQIKRNHELITTGIYQYIRHPIYLGLLTSYIGSEFVVYSYLAFIFLPLFMVMAYRQGKKEEAILLNHFGKHYQDYIQTNKMFIPFIF